MHVNHSRLSPTARIALAVLICLLSSSVARANPLLAEIGRVIFKEALIEGGKYGAGKAYEWYTSDDQGELTQEDLVYVGGILTQLENAIKDEETGRKQAIARLREDLSDKASREEVLRIVGEAMQVLDQKLFEQAAEVRRIQQTLAVHRQMLSSLREDFRYAQEKQARINQRVEEFRQEQVRENEAFRAADIRLSEESRATRQVVDDVRRDYPRYRPKENAVVLSGEGMLLLQENNNAEAIRALRLAHAIDPEDPGTLYTISLAYRRVGKAEYAEEVLARAIVLERRRKLQKWYERGIERIQGEERRWLEDQRTDPVFGIYVPGDLTPVRPTLPLADSR